MGKLTNKTALVTGSSRGIGRRIALRLATDGAFVLIHSGHSQDEAKNVLTEIKALGGNGAVLTADISSMASIQHMVTEVERLLLDEQQLGIDILVNNAGIGTTGTLTETTEDDFDRLVAVNIRAPFFLTKLLLSKINSNGRIINISSYSTRFSSPEIVAYSMTKGAINTFTLALAKTLAKQNITVNAILPGFIDTVIHGDILVDPKIKQEKESLSLFNRVGEPEDIAAIASFLASSDSRWVTGQLIDGSGGSNL